MASAADFLPPRRTLPSQRRAAEGCRGCELWRDATQTVFGEGAADADLMLVGEQPGDREDLEGEPFVGPAVERVSEAFGNTPAVCRRVSERARTKIEREREREVLRLVT